jgi:hypothetical protein
VCMYTTGRLCVRVCVGVHHWTNVYGVYVCVSVESPSGSPSDADGLQDTRVRPGEGTTTVPGEATGALINHRVYAARYAVTPRTNTHTPLVALISALSTPYYPEKAKRC